MFVPHAATNKEMKIISMKLVHSNVLRVAGHVHDSRDNLLSGHRLETFGLGGVASIIIGGCLTIFIMKLAACPHSLILTEDAARSHVCL